MRPWEIVGEDDGNNEHGNEGADTTKFNLPLPDWNGPKPLIRTAQDYLPASFDPSSNLRYPGRESDDQPIPRDYSDLIELTHWSLAQIQSMKVNNIVANMMQDPNLIARWIITPNIQYRRKYQGKATCFKNIILNPKTYNNHEASYIQMCGTVLRPEQSCTQCRDKKGKFQHCIIAHGYLGGACASCHYNIAGKKCSFRIGSISGLTKIDGMLATVPAMTPTPCTPLSTSNLHAKATAEQNAAIISMCKRLENIDTILTRMENQKYVSNLETQSMESKVSKGMENMENRLTNVENMLNRLMGVLNPLFEKLEK